MRNQLATVAVLMLLCAGMGSSALLSRAFAQSHQLSAAQQEKRIGPKPAPAWYWRWVQWRLGEGYAKGNALKPHLRPSHAPQLVPDWAWHKLHYYLLARQDRSPAGYHPKKHKAHKPTSTPPTTTPGSPPSSPPPSGSPGSVTPPAAPGSYSVPAGAVSVSSSAQLTSALAAGSKTIVLADGTYGGSSYFNDWNSSNLYAQHPQGAVLTAGLVVGGNHSSGGAVIRGLAFDVTSSGATFQNSEVNIWGAAGEGTQVLDSTFDGNWKVAVGLLAVNPDGLVAQRLQFSDFTDEALRATTNQLASYGASVPTIKSITDISIDGVSRSTPGASNGTAEAGLWIGQPVTDGVHRVRIRNVSWSGIETVNDSWNTDFSDLDINMSGSHAYEGVAVYLEHFSIGDTFENFSITGSKVGFNAEWNDGTPGNEAARNDTIANGTINASGWNGGGHTAGIFLDEGTGSTTISGVTFENQNWAGIGAYKNSGTNSISGNTYQLDTGAVSVSTGHL